MGNILKTAKALLAGTLLTAVFSFLPGPSVPQAHASMDHQTPSSAQICPVGCNSARPTTTKGSDQNPEEEKDEDPAPPEEPYYLQFLTFIAPKKLGAQYAYGLSPARPPDLVKLYANYRF